MHCHGVGRFVEDPELTETSNGKKVCHFRLSFPEVIKSDENDRKDYHYLPCVIWDTAAEFICSHFKQGDQIEIVDATARRDMWISENNEKRSKILFRINRFNKI